ncbi:MAG: hypothetical protein HY392_01835 [Candidatus Diapherotrites archaeon]|nr:hypothetical protein [Candidatus Diapherotrites archaeon]
MDSKDLFDKEKCALIAKKLASFNKNIIIFGLHNSGKSTLVKAICKADKKFHTLEEEEIISDDDAAKLLEKSKKLWAVGHQYPSQYQHVSEDFLQGFAAGMKLTQKIWIIIKIVKKT